MMEKTYKNDGFEMKPIMPPTGKIYKLKVVSVEREIEKLKNDASLCKLFKAWKRAMKGV